MVPAFSAQPKSKANQESKKQVVESFKKGDARLGKEKSDAERCQECHGVDGHGLPHSTGGSEDKFPKLAGQYPDYIVKQVRNFRTGERKDDTMSMMANSITDDDLFDIAAYFSEQKVMQGDGKEANPLGRNLYLNGDPSRSIQACVACHGEGGKGLSAGGTNYPVIGGQQWRYLEKQLLDWRSGQRKNSFGAVMSAMTKSLTDVEIKALVDYLSSL